MLPDLNPTGEVVVYEAEDQTLSGVDFKTSNPGFSGTGYADYRADDGYYVEFSNVDGGSGGWCILNFRYSMGSPDARPLAVTLNGEYAGELAIATTVDATGSGSWDVWEEETFVTVCDAGMNTIRVTSTVNRVGGPNLDYMSYHMPTKSEERISNNTLLKETISFQCHQLMLQSLAVLVIISWII
jgi:hypothetical protein